MNKWLVTTHTMHLHLIYKWSTCLCRCVISVVTRYSEYNNHMMQNIYNAQLLSTNSVNKHIMMVVSVCTVYCVAWATSLHKFAIDLIMRYQFHILLGSPGIASFVHGHPCVALARCHWHAIGAPFHLLWPIVVRHRCAFFAPPARLVCSWCIRGAMLHSRACHWLFLVFHVIFWKLNPANATSLLPNGLEERHEALVRKP